MATTDIIREAIRRVMDERPGIKGAEIAEELNISRSTVSAHIKAIRAEWKGEE